MSFLNPLALIGLALLAAPVVIHLLARRRARRLDFPTLRYLRETPSFRLRPRRIRQPWLLALRLLALALLVLGIARPLWTPQVRSQLTSLILLDASLSMRAPGRAAAAREEARAIINQLGSDERAAVISFSSETLVLAGLTADRAQLLAAVERYQPQSSTADFNAALRAVATLLERVVPGTAKIEMISDFQQSNLFSLTQESTRLSAPVRAHAVGAEVERNAFLLDDVMRKQENGLELSAAEVVSAADGRSAARRAWAIDTAASERPDIAWRTEVNGQVTGRLAALAPDDFDADDVRFFAFNPPRAARVLLIESDAETNLYVGAALESAVKGLGQPAPVLARQRHLPPRADDLNAYALVALTMHEAVSADELRLLTEYAAAGGTVWLLVGREVDTAQLNALAATDAGRALPYHSLVRLSSAMPFSLVPADRSAPPLRALTESALQALRLVNVREGYAFDTRADADTLLRWNHGAAAFVSLRIGSGRLLLLGTSLESAASDLNRSPAFPSLAFSVLSEAVAPREPLSFALGETVALGLAPESAVSVTGEAAPPAKVQARDLMQRPLQIFSKAGVYRLETERGERFVALNPPRAESERALASTVEVQQLFDGMKMSAAPDGTRWREANERGGNVWRYFLGTAFLLLLAELFLRVRQRGKQTVRTTEPYQPAAGAIES